MCKDRLLLVCAVFVAIGCAERGKVVSPPPVDLSRPQPNVTSEKVLRTLSEVVNPRDIQPEKGKCYTARLRFGRTADDGATRSVCVLMEDDKPLPHPHSVHGDIRNIGRGHYSHWRKDLVYFSASDGSDPRTNARTYALVSLEECVLHQASVVVRVPEARYSVSIPEDAGAEPMRVIWRNLDDEVSVAPHVKEVGWLDLTSDKAILRSIIKPGMTDEEKAIAIWQFLVDWRYHYLPAEGQDEVHDPAKFINVYGYGFCDDCAMNFAVLCRGVGIKARAYGLSGHVVGEALIGGKWCMFDPDHQVFYRKPDGKIASVDYLADRPELITATPKDPIGSDTKGIAKLYTTKHNNVWYEHKLSEKHELMPLMVPGDVVVFELRGGTLVHSPRFNDRPLPPVFGNGKRIRKIDVSRLPKEGNARIIEQDWTYVIVGAELKAELKKRGGELKVGISRDAKGWTETAVACDRKYVIVCSDNWFGNRKKAVYHYALKLEMTDGSDPAETIREIELTTKFQFAPRALATVKPGRTDFEAFLRFPTREPVSVWKGVEITQEWAESIRELPPD